MSDRVLGDLRSRLKLLESQVRRLLGTQHLTTIDVDVQDEGNPLGAADTLNFAGDAVSTAVAGGVATVTIDTSPSNIDFEMPSIGLGSYPTLGSSGKAINSDATIDAFDDLTPQAEPIGATGDAGTVDYAARSDHRHETPDAVTPTITLADTPAEGAAATIIRSDATIQAFDDGGGDPTQLDVGDTAVDGTVDMAARRDHQHAFPAPAPGYPVDVAAAEADGTATTVARADHRHAHGSGYLPDAHHAQSHGVGDHTTAITVDDEGVGQGDVNEVDFVGSGVSVAVAGAKATVTVTAVPPTFGTPAVVLGTVAAAGVVDEVIRRDSTIVAFDATTPDAEAFGDAGAAGSAAVAARRDHHHAMPANPVSFAAPTIALGTAAAAGAAATVIRSDATIVAFDATAPVTQAFGDVAAVGAAAVAARRDHKHGMPATPQAYATVQDEGVAVTQRTTLNFVGAGVTATDSGGVTVVTIAGGGGSGGSGWPASWMGLISARLPDGEW